MGEGVERQGEVDGVERRGGGEVERWGVERHEG